MNERIMEGVKKFFGCCFGIVIVIGLIAAGMKYQKAQENKYPWKGAFYRVTEEYTSQTDSGDFESLEKCREWAIEKADHYTLREGEYDYSCGTECTYKDNEIVDGKKVNNYECNELTK